jgi:hypothetical protein|nr:MAG TPA: hypothetical protein [Caudoviricetes sp.]
MILKEKIIDIFRSDSAEYKIKVILDGKDIAEDIAEFKLSYISSNNNMIGDINSKTIEMKLFNSSKYNITNKEILIFATAKNAEVETPREYRIGLFKILEIVSKDKKKDEVNVKGRDYSYLLNSKLKTTKEFGTYPLNVGTLIEKAKDATTLPRVLKKTDSIANINYILQRPVYVKDEVIGNLISQIAKITGCNIYIDGYNSLFYKKLDTNNVDFRFLKSDIFEQKITDIEVNGFNTVTASRISNGDNTTTEDVFYSIAQSGEKKREYKLLENWVIDDDRKSALPELLDSIKDIRYRGCEIQIPLALFIEPYDIYEVETDEGIIKIVAQEIIHNFTIRLTTIRCKVENETKTDYKRATLNEKIAKTEIKVDKALGVITAEVAKVTEKAKELTKFQADIEGLKLWKEAQIDLTDHRKGIGTIITKEAEDFNIVKYQAQGGTAYRYIEGLYPSEELFPSEDLFMPEKVGMEEIE